MATALKYTVLSGDTLSSISDGLNAAAGVTYQAIEQANPGIEPQGLQVGMLLNIPASNGSKVVLRYTVMPGDSYSGIAQSLGKCAGMTYQLIEQANPNVTPTTLGVGEVLSIPDVNAPAPSPVYPVVDAPNVGIWWWTYGSGTVPPTNANIGIAFSGWNDYTKALAESASLKGSLPGSKYISIGGGDPNTGSFNVNNLTALTNAINSGAFAGYDGIAYDIEEGTSGLGTLFVRSFAAAKAKGYKVLVTVSHSAPYGIPDSASLMQTFFADPNIDFLSPQLYSSGDETANNFDTTSGVDVTWAQYATAKAAVVPSIVNPTLYASAQTFFQQQGVTISGYIQWSQG